MILICFTSFNTLLTHFTKDLHGILLLLPQMLTRKFYTLICVSGHSSCHKKGTSRTCFLQKTRHLIVIFSSCILTSNIPRYSNLKKTIRGMAIITYFPRQTTTPIIVDIGVKWHLCAPRLDISHMAVFKISTQ